MKTVTFETAKQLYDLGVRIPAEKAYYWNTAEGKVCCFNKNTVNFGNKVIADALDYIVDAPDAQELEDALPDEIEFRGRFYHLVIHRKNGFHFPNYEELMYHYLLCPSLSDKRKPEALAEMLIWLIEDKYATVEQINKGE